EPVAVLAGERLGDGVRGDPLPPRRAIPAVAHRRVGDDARVQPGVPDVQDPGHRGPAPGAPDLDRVDPGPVRGMARELLPPFHRALAELVLAADHLERPAGPALPDGQGQPPVALLADHPIAHVLEPVQFALQAELGDPADLLRAPIMAVTEKIRWIPEFGLERELDWLKNIDRKSTRLNSR